MLIGKKKDSDKDASSKWLSIPCLLVILAVSYNSFLAIINANVMVLNTHYVALVEIAILLSITGYIALNFNKLVAPLRHLSFFAVMMLLSVMVMLANGEFFPKFIRDMYIIVAFVLLGTVTNEKDIIRIFKILAGITLAVAVIEIFRTNLYVSFFQPAKYYANTRGIAPLGSSGLFRGAVLSDTRFSFNFFSNHRISSIFLEQVSLANFSMVLSIFVISFWKSLTRKEILFFLLTIVFIILANDTRTGTIFTLALIPGFFVFPHLPRNWNVLIIPAVLIVSALLFYDPSLDRTNWEDDLPGRIGLTLYMIYNIDIQAALTGKLGLDIMLTMDSGYVYVVYASTLLGFFIYWLYTSLLVSSHSKAGKRFAYSTSLFIAVTLMVGAAIFTIKVGALLWLMGGFLYQQNYADKNKQKIKPRFLK